MVKKIKNKKTLSQILHVHAKICRNLMLYFLTATGQDETNREKGLKLFCILQYLIRSILLLFFL